MELIVVHFAEDRRFPTRPSSTGVVALSPDDLVRDLSADPEKYAFVLSPDELAEYLSLKRLLLNFLGSLSEDTDVSRGVTSAFWAQNCSDKVAGDPGRLLYVFARLWSEFGCRDHGFISPSLGPFAVVFFASEEADPARLDRRAQALMEAIQKSRPETAAGGPSLS